MSNISIASLRLGKTSVEAIKDLYQTKAGLTEPFKISVTCTQVPQELVIGMYVFIWLGSDNSKGIPTDWKQGYKAFGRVTALNRGASYNDESTTEVEILYAFGESVNRLDFLKLAAEAYYDCSALPIIGLDDHSNQTIRLLQDNGERFDISAMLYALNTIDKTLKPSLIKIDEGFQSLFSYLPPSLKTSSTKSSPNSKDLPRQIIYYGAPGTGKSHEVKNITGELKAEENGETLDNVFRTTFHPDTDYASFVGCYKPTMRDTGQVRIVDGKTEKVEEISYEFVPQTFTDAYVYACKNPDTVTYLVIEEINRGNCAQIFGDLFQLLDRKKDGTSEYRIKADTDLAKHLIKEGVASGDPKDVKLCLPANLHILATMNTSDQSLFPIDSAFKRRWDWEYVPISYTEEKSGAFEIEIGGEKYSWVKFIEAVNKRIFDLTQSEDKEMGNFFIKSSVDERQFKSKVMFYLWNEVLRDEVENSKYFFYAKDDNGNTEKFTFKDLYGDAATKILQGFMAYINKDYAD